MPTEISKELLTDIAALQKKHGEEIRALLQTHQTNELASLLTVELTSLRQHENL